MPKKVDQCSHRERAPKDLSCHLDTTNAVAQVAPDSKGHHARLVFECFVRFMYAIIEYKLAAEKAPTHLRHRQDLLMNTYKAERQLLNSYTIQQQNAKSSVQRNFRHL